MNKALAFLLLLLSMSCATESSQSNESYESVKNTPLETIDSSFQVNLAIDKLDTDLFNLAATIELDSGSYVVSPFSKDTIYGHFEIRLTDNNLILEEGLLETPNSVEEFDPILECQVRFVRVNTTYEQKIKVATPDDFEASGMVWFVHEPICIPYEVTFTLSYQAGEMEIKEINTAIAPEYKL